MRAFSMAPCRGSGMCGRHHAEDRGAGVLHGTMQRKWGGGDAIARLANITHDPGFSLTRCVSSLHPFSFKHRVVF
jgi:hypothetical protein